MSLVNRRELLTAAAASVLLASRGASAQRSDTAAFGAIQLDAIVERFIREFEIPGVAVGVVLPDRPPFVRGYGVRTLGHAARVDGNTGFAIASNSKAFLCACLALLVDEGALAWDDPVVKHLPEFKMADPAVTAMMTVRDLLVHRSGLPLGAGDLMQFPRTNHTREEILRSLPHFSSASGFRAGYAYDNSLYIVAGLVLERASGLDWDRFVTQRIFAPLGMTDAVSNPTLVVSDNRAGRHARLGPPARGMGRLEAIVPDESAVLGPAGGINVSVAGIVPWLQVQLQRGAISAGRRLWSEAQSAQMWQPCTLIASGPGPTAERPQQSVMQGYALGWGVADYRGRRMLSHAGGVAGQVTRITLLPEQGIGLAVYSNSEEGEAISALRYALLDALLEAPAFDWVASTKQVHAEAHAQVHTLLAGGDFAAPAGGRSLPLDRYVGRYRDAWYGDVIIARRRGDLTIDFTRTPAFKSRLEAFGPDTFRTRFARGAGEDSVVKFLVRDAAVAGITLKALSPLADFSFDFHHLHLLPVGS